MVLGMLLEVLEVEYGALYNLSSSSHLLSYSLSFFSYSFFNISNRLPSSWSHSSQVRFSFPSSLMISMSSLIVFDGRSLCTLSFGESLCKGTVSSRGSIVSWGELLSRCTNAWAHWLIHKESVSDSFGGCSHRSVLQGDDLL